MACVPKSKTDGAQGNITRQVGVIIIEMGPRSRTKDQRRDFQRADFFLEDEKKNIDVENVNDDGGYDQYEGGAALTRSRPGVDLSSGPSGIVSSGGIVNTG